MEYVRDHYRHGKTILALGSATSVLEACGIDLSEPDAGIVMSSKPKQGIASFIAALSAHRHKERETDPPRL
jgi:catalase